MAAHRFPSGFSCFEIIFILRVSYRRTGRGFINKAQLGELMDTLGIDATAEEVDLMLSEIDLGTETAIPFVEDSTYHCHEKWFFMSSRPLSDLS